jgi:acetolactate synthase-1/2/3 large subunit
VKDPRRVRYELERAYWCATAGRPGPVIVEFPLDVQAATIDAESLEGFTPEFDAQSPAFDIGPVLDALQSARRPLFVAGNGVHLSGSRALLYELLERTGIPIVLPMTAKDLVHEEHPQLMGILGPTGQRRANFAVQNADCLIGLAAGLNLQKVGFNLKGFAPKARKIFVDVDAGQLTHQALKPDLAVHAEIGAFLKALLREVTPNLRPPQIWLDACRAWKERYPAITPDYFEDSEHVNTYAFMDELSRLVEARDLVVTGNGTEVASYYQAFRVQKSQRAFCIGWGACGWDLPVAIGSCVGSGKRRTVCVTGDGGIQWNIQELLTIRNYRLPIKIFVVNNQGYTCIRGTQNNFFEGRFVGSDPQSGVANPDFRRLAEAYNIPYTRIRDNSGLADGIAGVLETDGPVFCELNVAVEQGISPRASSFRRADGAMESRPIEDLAPFLPREEVWENMHLFHEEPVEAAALP